jgi:hypothetical protein
MAVEQSYGKMVTDGLVLYLNAADRNSYVSGSSVWNDLSNNKMVGELVNSPTFNSSNSGYFEFATDDLIRIQNNTSLDTQTPTVEVWIKTNALNQNGFFFEKGTVNTQYSLFQEGTNIVWRQITAAGTQTFNTTTATYINTSNWYQIVGTYVSGDRRVYINGVMVNSDANTGTIQTNSGGMSIGAFGGYSGGRGYYYNGNLAICRVYNKVLSPSEILQNYNATKTRFGLT